MIYLGKWSNISVDGVPLGIKAIGGKLMEPETQAYIDRVTAGLGVVNDVTFTNDVIAFCKERGIYDNLRTMVGQPFGMHLRDGQFVTRAFDASPAAIDFTQTTETKQPIITPIAFSLAPDRFMLSLTNDDGFIGKTGATILVKTTNRDGPGGANVFGTAGTNLALIYRNSSNLYTALALYSRRTQTDPNSHQSIARVADTNEYRVYGGRSNFSTGEVQGFSNKELISSFASTQGTIDQSQKILFGAAVTGGAPWGLPIGVAILFNSDIGEQNYFDLVDIINNYYSDYSIVARQYGTSFANDISSSALTVDDTVLVWDDDESAVTII